MNKEDINPPKIIPNLWIMSAMKFFQESYTVM